jgi:hypothetical protein
MLELIHPVEGPCKPFLDTRGSAISGATNMSVGVADKSKSICASFRFIGARRLGTRLAIGHIPSFRCG